MRQSFLAAILCGLFSGFGGLHAAVSEPVAGISTTSDRLPDLIADQGIQTVATELTRQNRWSVVRDAVLHGAPGMQTSLPGLLRLAPGPRQPMLRAALRQRLVQDPVETIALFDPAHGAPFNGTLVCATGDRSWRQRAARAIASTHDVIHALQRIDCLHALGVANPG